MYSILPVSSHTDLAQLTKDVTLSHHINRELPLSFWLLSRVKLRRSYIH
jgi:hypothetical protein